MKPNLKRSVIEHLEAKRLDESQLRDLEKLQRDGRSWLRIRQRRIQFVIAASILLVLAAVLLRPETTEVAWDIANEVALNHLRQRPLEIQGADVASLQPYFGELDFRLVQTSYGIPAGSQMLGGRYCSIQDVTAAQLRLRDDAGRMRTLYQVPYDEDRFGPLPDIRSGGGPRSTQVRGLTVDLWVEKGLLFALTRE